MGREESKGEESGRRREEEKEEDRYGIGRGEGIRRERCEGK